MRRIIAVAAALLAATPAYAITLDEVIADVTEATEQLPDNFSDYGVQSTEKLMVGMPSDVFRYARWFWTVDFIEGNCEYLGQRSNIEMLSPENSVSTWLMLAAIKDEHPDHDEYMRIYEQFDAALTDLGDIQLCSAMYDLLGPNGSLMGDAVNVNGLIDPELLDTYVVTPEDGVLWSSKDYCERRHYLEPPASQDSHDFSCQQAAEQPF